MPNFSIYKQLFFQDVKACRIFQIIVQYGIYHTYLCVIIYIILTEGCILCTQTYNDIEMRSRRMAMHFDGMDDDDDDNEYEALRNESGPPVTLTTEGHCDRLVLMSVLAPIGHTYVTVAEALESLVGTAVAEAEFVRDCVQRMQTKVESNQCRYGEWMEKVLKTLKQITLS